MMFKQQLVDLIVAGEKTVTRRPTSSNRNSPWSQDGCKLRVGRDYAICPGRGAHGVARVVIDDVRRERLVGAREPGEAQLEGFASFDDFRRTWVAINGGAFIDSTSVWRIEFHLLEAPVLELDDVVAA